MKTIDKFYGCLIGGAAGDALGYEVEFMKEPAIFEKFGKNGITEYALTNGRAIVSDDTQMTFFTANGLLMAAAQETSPSHQEWISDAYFEWYRSQTDRFTEDTDSPFWLMRVEELFHHRAPGNTCMYYSALGAKGTVEHPENTSCGCGGVMRVAPIGLLFDNKVYTPDWITMLGAQAAAATHGHPLGYMPAAALVYLVNHIVYDDVTLQQAAEDTLTMIQKLFSGTANLHIFSALISAAIGMSRTDEAPLDCIHKLGEGWKGHDAFAIALYCALKFEDDFDMAIRTSVNHKGDSDSTGAIAGNILGAYLGLSAIPEKYLRDLEMVDVAKTLAEDLYLAGEVDDDTWKARYTA